MVLATDGYHLKLYQPSVSLKTSINQLSNRKEQINLHHLRLGRSSLNSQDPIHRKELKDKLCDFCDDIEDTAHFLLHCQRYSAQRHKLKNELEAIYNQYNVAKEHRQYNELILSDNNAISQAANSNILKVILQFIRDTKRFWKYVSVLYVLFSYCQCCNVIHSSFNSVCKSFSAQKDVNSVSFYIGLLKVSIMHVMLGEGTWLFGWLPIDVHSIERWPIERRIHYLILLCI